MEIIKIALFFVILGLATCGADRCDVTQLNQAIQSCATSMISYMQVDGDDPGKICSAFKTVKTCFADATNGCEGPVVSIMSQVLASFKNFESLCSGYPNGLSTTVVNTSPY